MAGEIRSLLDGGVAAEDIAVVLRTPGPAVPLLAEVFAAAAIPCTVQRRLRFGDTGVGRGLCALLRCVADDADGAALLTWLRASAREGELELADALERRARASGVTSVSGLRALWDGERTRPLQALDRLAAAARRGPVALLSRVGAELDGLFSAPWHRDAHVLDAEDSAEASAVAAAQRALVELLECARATRELRLDLRSIIDALAGLELVAGDPPGPGAVAVVDPLALRARRVRALFVCGLQEGTFPAMARTEPFLGEDDRRELARASGVRLGLGDDPGAERYLLYACVSRPRELLCLSWHTADDDGAPAAPSSYLDEVRSLFGPELWAQRRRRPLGAVGWPGPGEAPTAVQALAPAPPAARHPEPPLPPLVNPTVLGVLAQATWSPSGLEAWISCPVKWFVERHLRADDLEPDPEPLTRGSILHDVLETTHRRLREQTGSARLVARATRARAGADARGAGRAAGRAGAVRPPGARGRGAPAPAGGSRPLSRACRARRQSVGAGRARAVVRLRRRRASCRRPR